jgi:hypothetical protein
METFKAYLSKVVADGKSDRTTDDADDGESVNYMSAYFRQQSNASRQFFSDKQLIISMQVRLQVFISTLIFNYFNFKNCQFNIYFTQINAVLSDFPIY